MKSRKAFAMAAAIVISALVLTGCGSSGNSSAASVASNSSAESPQAQTVSLDQFIADVNQAIDGTTGEGEAITSVSLDGDTLTIEVDMSKADPSPFSIEDVAINRVSSITDPILELDQYDELWQQIVIDYGDLGQVTCSKSDIDSNEYGRFFNPDKMTLEQ